MPRGEALNRVANWIWPGFRQRVPVSRLSRADTPDCSRTLKRPTPGYNDFSSHTSCIRKTIRSFTGVFVHTLETSHVFSCQGGCVRAPFANRRLEAADKQIRIASFRGMRTAVANPRIWSEFLLVDDAIVLGCLLQHHLQIIRDFCLSSPFVFLASMVQHCPRPVRARCPRPRPVGRTSVSSSLSMYLSGPPAPSMIL